MFANGEIHILGSSITYYDFIKDMVQIVFYFFMAWIAYQGLSTWRRQSRSKFNEELATKIHNLLMRYSNILASNVALEHMVGDCILEKNTNEANNYKSKIFESHIELGILEKKLGIALNSASLVWGENWSDIVVSMMGFSEKYNEYLSVSLKSFESEEALSNELNKKFSSFLGKVTYDLKLHLTFSLK